MADDTQQLFLNQVADGVSPTFKVYERRQFVNIWVAGTLNSGTVTIQALAPDGTTWVPINGGVITEPQMVTLEMAPTVLRLSLTGGTGAADVSAWVAWDSRSRQDAVREA